MEGGREPEVLTIALEDLRLATRYLPRFGARCESALPAAFFEALLVRLSRSAYRVRSIRVVS